MSTNWGGAIKLIRTQKDMSQAQLAEKCGLSISYVSLLERNKRDPKFSTMEQIAKGLEVPLTIIAFYATDHTRIAEISTELVEKLSAATLNLIKGK